MELSALAPGDVLAAAPDAVVGRVFHNWGAPGTPARGHLAHIGRSVGAVFNLRSIREEVSVAARVPGIAKL